MNDFTLQPARFADPAAFEVTTSVNGAATANSAVFSADINARDWDCLFAAVIERLRFTTGKQFANEHPAANGDTLLALKKDVNECVGALTQLRTSLGYELKLRDQLAEEIEHTRRQLAQVHAQVASDYRLDRDMRAHRLSLHDSVNEGPRRSADAEK